MNKSTNGSDAAEVTKIIWGAKARNAVSVFCLALQTNSPGILLFAILEALYIYRRGGKCCVLHTFDKPGDLDIIAIRTALSHAKREDHEDCIALAEALHKLDEHGLAAFAIAVESVLREDES